MSKNARPRRSILYMPGSNARALEKGRTLAADGLIQLNADAMTILPAGRLLAHAVCMQFDHCLPPRPASRFSQAM